VLRPGPTVEISTGTIQRALTQAPLLTRGMASVVPLVGDLVMVRPPAGGSTSPSFLASRGRGASSRLRTFLLLIPYALYDASVESTCTTT